MKECELCEMAARMYCESDEASLCWKCDAKVHGANFLVARHSRSLLCQVCQDVTAWRASGSNPGPTVSVCEKCVARSGDHQSDGDGNDENQVVPFASGVSGPPPSSPSTDEEEEEEHEGDFELEADKHEDHYVENFTLPLAGSVSGSNPVAESSSLKRRHETLDLLAAEGDDYGCSCSGPSTSHNWASSRSGCEDDATSFDIHILKKRKEDDANNGRVVEELERIQREGSSNSTTVSAICKLCGDSRPSELVSVSSIDS